MLSLEDRQEDPGDDGEVGKVVGPLQIQDVSPVVAFLHGILSFFTPCMFPLIPLLLPFALSRGWKGTFGFSLGFVLTFAILGIIPQSLRAFIPAGFLSKLAGIFVIVMGILFAAGVSGRSGKILKTLVESGERIPPAAAGVLVGFVWMACSTPILASILAMIALEESRLRGILCMILYSLGILIPFAVFGKFLSEFLENLSEGWKRIIRIAGGALIVMLGIHMLLTYTV